MPSAGLHIVKTHEFDLPCARGGIACDQEGNVAVCGSDNTVYIFTQEGKKLSEIRPGCDIMGVAAKKDRWYITQDVTDNGKLFIYDTKGRHINTVSVGYKGYGGVAVSELHLYITSAKENAVYRLELPDGSNNKVFIKNSWFTKYLDNPMYVATNGKSVAVSSNNSHQVSLFDIDGTHLFVYGREGSGPGRLLNPLGVAIDGQGRVHFADWGNNRISILSSQGHHLFDIELGQKHYPRGLALTDDDKIIVGCGSWSESRQRKIIIYQYAK